MNLTKEYYSYKNPLVPVREFFSLKARNKMYHKFLKLITPNEKTSILDLGATPDTLLKDSNFLEKLYPHKENITVASIEDCHEMVEKYGCKAFCYNTPKEALPFKDKEFDVCFCSATLEHVGTRDDQIFFLNECMRVSKQIFITTPNRYFPIEMHTFIPLLHWLPWSIFQRIVKKLVGPFYADINNLNLLSTHDIKKMQPSLSGCGGVKINYVRTLFFKSNLIITK
jgi:2-polyprenyl-3-methyl-5-hydroxy-6-metoxy-1,4-benzoquinol methylase